MSYSSQSSRTASSEVHDAILEQLGVIERAMILNKEIAEQLLQMDQNFEPQTDTSISMPHLKSFGDTQAPCRPPPKEFERLDHSTWAADLRRATGSSSSHLGQVGDESATFEQEASKPFLSNDSLSFNGMIDRKQDKLQRHGSVSMSSEEKKEIMKEVGGKGSAMRMEAMFHDTEDIEERIASSIKKLEYNVESLYLKEGPWQRIARSEPFKDAAFVFIILNTIYVGVSTDLNNADSLLQASLPFQLGDNFFCFIFCIELLIRYMAFRSCHDALSDNWFKFDAVLVATMAWETWVMTAADLLFNFSGQESSMDLKGVSVFRIFRLIRVFRAVRASRLLDMVPELMILARGIVAGLRSVFAVLVLLGLLIYIYAIIFTLQFKGTGVADGAFDSVPHGMNTLLLQVLCGPDSKFLHSFLETSYLYYGLIIMYIVFAVFTIMNMLIGILCDSVARVSQDENDQHFAKRVASQINRLAKELDKDQNGVISESEFDYISKDPQLAAAFQDLDVDLVGVVDFGRFIFAQTDEISYVNFGKMVAQFRGSRAATVNDVTDVRRYVSMELVSLESRLEAYLIHDILTKLESLIDSHDKLLTITAAREEATRAPTPSCV